MSFDATVAGENANSYVTVEFADDFLAILEPDWDAKTDAQKQKALIQATAFMDQRYKWRWKTPVSESQALVFPVVGYDKNGNELSETEIPKEIKQACCHLAFIALDNNLWTVDNPSIKREKTSKSEIEYFEGSKRLDFKFIDSIVSHFTKSMYSFDIVRG